MISRFRRSLIGISSPSLFPYITLAFFFLPVSNAISQTTPDMAVGESPYAVYKPSEIDNVNPLNGNLYLKLPLVSFPQRGDKLRLNFNIYYNDKQWHLYTTPLCIANVATPGTCYYNGQVTAQWTVGSSPNSPGANVGVYVARDQFAQYGRFFSSYYGVYGEEGSNYSVSTQYIGYYVETPDGSNHIIGDGYTQYCSQLGGTCPSGLIGNATNFYYATDGSGYDPAGHDPDGVSYSLTSAILTGSTTPNAPATVSDPNGNSITATLTGWTDSMGRTIPGTLTAPGFSMPSIVGGGAVSVSDLIPGIPMSAQQLAASPCPTGTSSGRVWNIPASSTYNSGSATYYFCYKQFTYNTNFNVSGVIPNWKNYWESVSESGSGQETMLSAIILPDGNAYTFSYDSYLSLIQLGLPSGASINYTWQNIPFSFSVTPAMQTTTTPISRSLQTRTVMPGGGQPSSTTTYHWALTPISSPSSQVTAYSIITDSSGNDEEYPLTGADGSGAVYLSVSNLGHNSYTGCGPHDTSSTAVCTPSSGTLMQSVTNVLTAYSGGGSSSGSPFNLQQAPVIPTTITTSVRTSSGSFVTSKLVKTLTPSFGTCVTTNYNPSGTWIGSNTYPAQVNDYTTSYTPCFTTGQIASAAQYDYGSVGSNSAGALLRTDTTTYEWQLSPPYLTANNFSLVGKTITTNGSGVWAAETDYGYDESPSPSGTHGNQTSTIRYSSPSAVLKSQLQYNAYGVTTLAIDPKGNQTSYSSFACNNSLPQVITRAYGSTTTTPETSNYGYDCNTGSLTTISDPNGVNRTYTYDDPFGRPTLIKSAVGTTSESWITETYPSPTQMNSAQDQSIKGDGVLQSQKTYDGLGRIIHATSPGGITVDTNYDSIGRVASVSNSHLSSISSTDGLTTYTYDSLSRMLFQYHPDQSYLSWTYNGNITNSFDETGRQWQRTTDALGHLTRVLEPDGSNSLTNPPTLETDYSYDSLGDLQTVSQIGLATEVPRSRSFTYDALSRLLCSSNPEASQASCPLSSTTLPVAGALNYSYDPNGNVATRTDSRGVITSYSYDALDRLLTKSYSGNSSIAAITPPSSYSYDSTSVPNSIGRLTGEITGLAANPTTIDSIGAYDPVGHVITETVCVTVAFCAPPTPPVHRFSNTSQYSYNLAGSVLSSNNGMTANSIVFTNTFDSANRLQTITSSINTSSEPSGLFGPETGSLQYGPAGLNSMALGISSTTQQPAFVTVHSFDNRMRLVGSATVLQTVGTPTQSSASITITGSEGSHEVCTTGLAQAEMSPAVSAPPIKCVNIADTGTLVATVNGFSASAGYMIGSTDSTVATALAKAFSASGSPVVATSNGSTVNMTSVAAGATTNYAYSVSNGADFYGTDSGATMTGGSNGPQLPFYSYSIPSTGGYAPNSNVLLMNDSVMGGWTYSYDNLNRLVTAQANANTVDPFGSEKLTWSYDSFGNSKGYTLSGSGPAMLTPAPYTYLGKSLLNGVPLNGKVTNQIDGFNYDAAGNQLNDPIGGLNTYVYDGEGRLFSANGTTQYMYDAEGRRVAKLTVNNGTASLAEQYLLGLNGEQVTELDGQGSWLHTNVYAAGTLLATYNASGLHFQFSDALGTRRVQGTASGTIEETCLSLPFGADLTCTGLDATEQHFTGKERDTESGLDYFGARYYASLTSRWLSPDPSMDSAIMELPQTWNKYSYVYNRPMFGTDPDGRCPPCVGALVGGLVEGGWNLGSQLFDNHGQWSDVNWHQVEANAAGGAVAGALAGATGGGSLLADAFIGAGSNVVGGATTRALDPTVDPDDILSAGEVSSDAVAGFIGGVGGHIASDYVHEPQDLGQRPNGRRKGLKYDKAARKEASGRRSALAAGTLASSPLSHGVSYLLHHAASLWDWLLGPPPPPPPPIFKVTMTILDYVP